MLRRTFTIAGLLLAVLQFISAQIVDSDWQAQRRVAPNDSTWQADVDRLTWLDTTVVLDVKKDISILKTRVTCRFANRLKCRYQVADKAFGKELFLRGPSHIYNCRPGDVVVVRILLLPSGEPRIVEFVDDLSNY